MSMKEGGTMWPTVSALLQVFHRLATRWRCEINILFHIILNRSLKNLEIYDPLVVMIQRLTSTI